MPRVNFRITICAWCCLLAGCATQSLVFDRNPDPDVLEINLVAARTAVELTEDGLIAQAYTFNGQTPGPELRLKVGDTAIVHFRNELQEPMNVHWHGIELDNANDGTPVTQNPVAPGETFTYRFKVTRPGIFWYHPHAMPTNFEFKGLYGPLIVTDNADDTLIAENVLPDESQTRTLMLGDTTVCKAPGENDPFTYAPDANLAWVHADTIGPFPGLTAYPSPADLCERPRDRHGMPTDSGPLDAGQIPNIMPSRRCMAQSRQLGLPPEAACRVNEGQLVLSNGRTAAARQGLPEQPGALTGEHGVIDVMAGQGLRLRLINAAVSRYFWLRMTDQDGNPVTLFRVGGEGGLLDRVRVEGGLQGDLDTKTRRGDIVLGVADREDIVVRVPDADIGDVLTLWTLDYQHYGTLQYPFGYGGLPTVPVLHLHVVGKNSGGDAFRIAAGDPLRAHPAVDDPVESIRNIVIVDELLDPETFSVPRPGTDSPELLLAVVGLRESIDGVHGTLLEGEVDNFTAIDHLPSSRYAQLGDTLELSFRNGTQMHHPMHLHGFSYQPLRITDLDDNLVYEYDYNEFVDTVDVPAVHKLTIRVRLEDRPWFESGEPGGGAGRWLIHCHIFNHAGLGMISELVVIDPQADSSR